MTIWEDNSKEFEIAPIGLAAATCYLVATLGTQTFKNSFTQTEERKLAVWIGFEFADLPMADGRPFVIGNRYKLIAFEKSTLAKTIKSWTGEVIDRHFDIGKLVGLGCNINVIHTEKNDQTYANINSIVSLMKNQVLPPTKNQLVNFSVHDFDGKDMTAFNLLPPFIRKMIETSPEFLEAQRMGKSINQHMAEQKLKTAGHALDKMPPSSPAPAVPPSETLPDFIKGKGKRPAGFDLADYDLSTAVGAKAAKTALLAVLDPLTPTARAEKFEELKGSTLVAALWNHGLEEDANQFTAKMAA